MTNIFPLNRILDLRERYPQALDSGSHFLPYTKTTISTSHFSFHDDPRNDEIDAARKRERKEVDSFTEVIGSPDLADRSMSNPELKSARKRERGYYPQNSKTASTSIRQVKFPHHAAGTRCRHRFLFCAMKTYIGIMAALPVDKG